MFLDPSICCHVHNETANAHIPLAPRIHDLYFWETSIDALGVRQMPGSILGWALLQVGTSEVLAHEAAIYDYWSGRDHGYFTENNGKRPRTTKGRYMNNQGGWMGTRRQVLEWHAEQCRDGFLPPFYHSQLDGLGPESVEWWSGGQQLAGARDCNLVRVIPLEPRQFARHLLYHTSNNKQRSGNVQHRFSSRTIQEFWGQLNTVRKNAEQAMHRQQKQQATNQT